MSAPKAENLILQLEAKLLGFTICRCSQQESKEFTSNIYIYSYIYISWIIISYLKYINHTSYMNQLYPPRKNCFAYVRLFRGIDTIIKHSGLKGLSDSWWNIKRGAVDWSWQGTHGNAQWLRPNLHVLQHFDSRSLQWETSGDSLGNNPWRLEIF